MPKHARSTYLLALAVALLGAPVAASAATIGFNQTGPGAYDYNDPVNWAGGNIDGIWDSSLTLASSQTVTFSHDTTLATGLTFSYAGAHGLTLDAATNPATYKMTLGGDILVNPSSTQTITIGDSNFQLNVDLGGVVRTFTVASGKTLDFINTISNGSFTATGGGKVDLFRAGAAPMVDITVNNGTTLIFEINTSGSGTQTTTRAKSVTLTDGNLSVAGHTNANSAETVTGAVTIDGSLGGVDYVSLSPATATPPENAELSAGSLVRNHGVAVLTGTNLGLNSIASQTAGAANISLGATPTMIGGGGALGTTTMSIIPWAIGSTTTATGSGGAASFVTYDATNGIHPLSASEYATTIGDGTTTTNNVFLNSAVAAFGNLTSATTINSLYLTGANSTLGGPGKLTITSGAVFMTSANGIVISCPIDFGTQEGVIGSTSGKTSTISGAISGSGGLTIYQAAQSGFVSASLALSGSSSTYTGDTYVLGGVQVSSNTVLPHGSRTGDVYVEGALEMNIAGTTLINGLNGSGSINFKKGGTGSLSLGDNNANGLFTGTISNSAPTLSLLKIGMGVQTFGGTNTYTGTTTITGGTLALSGSGSVNFSSGLSVNGTGASFITNSSTAVTIPVTITKGTIGGTGTISAPGGVSIGANATISPGNSPGAQAYTTGLTWAGGGSYLWQINNANGAAGTNYDQLNVTGGLNITADTVNTFTIDIAGLTAGNVSGAVPNFNNGSDYAWLIAKSDALPNGFAADRFALDSSSFEANNPLDSGSFSIHQGNESVPGVALDNNPHDIFLVFTVPTPIPEPASLGLLAIGGLALLKRRRRA